MRSVAIIGAGPGGLVAAKTLLTTQPKNAFHITIFEEKDHIGGLWGVKEHETNGFLNADTPTNLSRFSVAFSDLSWADVARSRNVNGDRFPMFPKAWQVGVYLDEYAKRNRLYPFIKLSTSVTRLCRNQGSRPSTRKWEVEWQDLSTGRQSKDTFDFAILASAFASRSKQTNCEMLNIPKQLSERVIHSSQYADLSTLLSSAHFQGVGKILVVGGANSGGEIAASLAFQQSSAIYSSSTISSDILHNRIVHVMSRPIYAMPHFVPASSDTHAFVPWDIRVYDLSSRPKPIIAGFGLQPPAIANVFHQSVRGFLGGDQKDLSPSLTYREDQLNTPPYAAITESYSEFVRSGAIQPVLGKLVKLTHNGESDGINANGDLAGRPSDSLQALVESKDGTLKNTEGFDAVVFANGYSAIASLSVLSQDVLQNLSYDEANQRLPILLQDCQTHSPAVQGLGFIGFYEGPYWGVMEMQARLLRDMWLRDGEMKASSTFEGIEKQQELRKDILSKHAEVPQYWMSDYLGIMEQASDHLNLDRFDGLFGPDKGPIAPARYVDNLLPSNELVKTTIDELEQVTRESRDDLRFASKATCRALQGYWSIHRRLDSNNEAFPSGVFRGHAHFHPREPSKFGVDMEHLYVEEGLFQTDKGLKLNATRSYVYRYTELTDELSIWFVKEDGFTTDYLFHTIKFENVDTSGDTPRWVASGSHLCEKDMYKTSYGFPFRGIALQSFDIRHEVWGPNKDYSSMAQYSRS